MVKFIGIGEKSGKIKLSRKAPHPHKPEGEAVCAGSEERPRERRPRPMR